ncbi:proline-rich protein 36-like [Homarus americanus]|uniref:proline-rich protein 36-like n=1 Tax=Homarus americanus TaxID=6706 RepID=UPI001C45A2C1|nr:proline-rich protein 36-like [Homarus americanus]
MSPHSIQQCPIQCPSVSHTVSNSVPTQFQQCPTQSPTVSHTVPTAVPHGSPTVYEIQQCPTQHTPVSYTVPTVSQAQSPTVSPTQSPTVPHSLQQCPTQSPTVSCDTVSNSVLYNVQQCPTQSPTVSYTVSNSALLSVLPNIQQCHTQCPTVSYTVSYTCRKECPTVSYTVSTGPTQLPNSVPHSPQQCPTQSPNSVLPLSPTGPTQSPTVSHTQFQQCPAQSPTVSHTVSNSAERVSNSCRKSVQQCPTQHLTVSLHSMAIFKVSHTLSPSSVPHTVSTVSHTVFKQCPSPIVSHIGSNNSVLYDSIHQCVLHSSQQCPHTVSNSVPHSVQQQVPQDSVQQCPVLCPTHGSNSVPHGYSNSVLPQSPTLVPYTVSNSVPHNSNRSLSGLLCLYATVSVSSPVPGPHSRSQVPTPPSQVPSIPQSLSSNPTSQVPQVPRSLSPSLLQVLSSQVPSSVPRSPQCPVLPGVLSPRFQVSPVSQVLPVLPGLCVVSGPLSQVLSPFQVPVPGPVPAPGPRSQVPVSLCPIPRSRSPGPPRSHRSQVSPQSQVLPGSQVLLSSSPPPVPQVPPGPRSQCPRSPQVSSQVSPVSLSCFSQVSASQVLSCLCPDRLSAPGVPGVPGPLSPLSMCPSLSRSQVSASSQVSGLRSLRSLSPRSLCPRSLSPGLCVSQVPRSPIPVSGPPDPDPVPSLCPQVSQVLCPQSQVSASLSVLQAPCPVPQVSVPGLRFCTSVLSQVPCPSMSCPPGPRSSSIPGLRALSLQASVPGPPGPVPRSRPQVLSSRSQVLSQVQVPVPGFSVPMFCVQVLCLCTSVPRSQVSSGLSVSGLCTSVCPSVSQVSSVSLCLCVFVFPGLYVSVSLCLVSLCRSVSCSRSQVLSQVPGPVLLSQVPPGPSPQVPGPLPGPRSPGPRLPRSLSCLQVPVPQVLPACLPGPSCPSRVPRFCPPQVLPRSQVPQPPQVPRSPRSQVSPGLSQVLSGLYVSLSLLSVSVLCLMCLPVSVLPGLPVSVSLSQVSQVLRSLLQGLCVPGPVFVPGLRCPLSGVSGLSGFRPSQVSVSLSCGTSRSPVYQVPVSPQVLPRSPVPASSPGPPRSPLSPGMSPGPPCPMSCPPVSHASPGPSQVPRCPRSRSSHSPVPRPQIQARSPGLIQISCPQLRSPRSLCLCVCIPRSQVKVGEIRQETNTTVITGALLDSVSNRPSCTESLANRLRITGKSVSISIGMILKETKSVKAKEIDLKPEKLRTVFDCAATYESVSLNSQVMQGSDLNNKLMGVLISFRQEKLALMADIEAMFHQVRVLPEHRDILHFLWWTDDQLSVQLHHFCDASQQAYGAVSYLRITSGDGAHSTSFVCGRAKVAPLKQQTIPRLELCAAVLAAKADKQLREELELQIDRSVFSTDSMVTLHYI